MKLLVEPASRPLSGTITIPGDKSIGHRALLFSLLSATPVRVLGLGDGADNGRSAKAITALGATIERDGDAFVITGHRPRRHDARPAGPIDCGNSGTTIRLLCGLLAGQRVRDHAVRRRVAEQAADAPRDRAARADGRADRGAGHRRRRHAAARSSARRRAGSRAIDYALPMASAQVKTAILLAGLYADGATVVTEPGPSRDHSERMLAYLGAPLVVDGSPHRRSTRAAGIAGSPCAGFEVPADPSSAAFLVAAALVAGAGEVRLPGVCINPTRTGFLDVIAAMGGRVALEDPRAAGPEPSPTSSSAGRAASCAATEIAGDLAVRSIDELPILAVLAARAHGTTDRARRRGAAGQGVRPHRDHVRDAARVRRHLRGAPGRLRRRGPARSSARAGARPRRRRSPDRDGRGGRRPGRARATTRIDDADNVATSYPGFAAALTHLGAAVVVER